MQLAKFLLVGGVAAASASAQAQTGPVQKIIALLGDMQTKSIKEGTTEQANFETMQRWCEKQSWNKHRAIAEEKKQITAAKAQIETSESNKAQLSANIEKLGSKISENERELASANKLRKDQKVEFEKKDAILVNTIDTLTRAAKVLRKHMKGGNAFLQSKANAHLLQVRDALSSVVRASFISLEDKVLINNLLQSDRADKDDASFLSLAGPPQASTSNYDNKSGGIVETFENLKEKAEATRSAAQKDEMKANAGFMLLEQSTKDEIKALKNEMEDAKKKMSRAEETKALATGNLANVSKDLKADAKYLEDSQRECMNAATEFENGQKSRAEELGVLAKAKEILSSAAFVQLASKASTAAPAADSDASTSDADDDSMASAMGLSFLQVRMSASVKQSLLSERESEAAGYLRKEGKRMQSWMLTQLGSKIGSSNPAFAKVTRMVQDMISKLEKEMAGEADQHAWCTSENKKTDTSLQLKSDKLDEMRTRFEQATSNKQQLLDQVKMLQGELRDMDKSQQGATELRAAERKGFGTARKDLSNAQNACATAIKVLKEYYGAQSDSSADATSLMQVTVESLSGQPAGSAASSIIGMLEVAEADFSRNLAEATTTEDQKANEYDVSTDDNRVSKAAKDADIRNKTSEIKRLESLINETNMDVNDATSEKSAVEAYKQKLKKNCETKAPSYEDRQKRRQEEMEGLKNALDILNGNGVALVQSSEEAADELLSGLK